MVIKGCLYNLLSDDGRGMVLGGGVAINGIFGLK